MLSQARNIVRLFLLALCSIAAVFAQNGQGPLRAPLLDEWQDKMTRSTQALKAGRPQEAIRLCDEALEMASHFGPDDPHLARSQVQRAYIYIWEKKYDDAERMLHTAIATTERAFGSDSVELVHPLSMLANFYYYTKPQHDRVITLFERILNISEHAKVRDDQQVIMWTRNLAQVHQELGHFEVAEPLFLRALELTEKADPQWTSHQQLTVAQFYRAWKKYDRAETHARQALEWREKALKTKPDNVDAKLDVSVALDELGAIHFAANQLDQAEAECRRSLEIDDTFMGPDQSDLRPRLSALGNVLRAEKKYDEAAKYFARLVSVTEKCAGANNPDLAEDLSQYAAVLRQANKLTEASAAEARAAEIRKHATAG